MRHWIWLLGAVLTSSSLAPCQSVTVPNHVVEVYTANINPPTGIAFIGPDDILVLHRGDGRVRRVIGGVQMPDEVLDVSVNANSERGLLGIALDPDFINNGYVYLYYTEAPVKDAEPLANRVYRYTWNGKSLGEPLLVLDLPVLPGDNHNGGIILFGADDKLYTMIGDLNHQGKLQNNGVGPDPDDTSVILRTNADGSAPPDNPFYVPNNPLPRLDRYYAYGVRNSFGMAVDPLTGALWDTENGPESYDEVNRIDPGTNSGWAKIMGPDSRDPEGLADLWVAPGSFYSDPEFSWNSPVGPTTIAFLRSPKLGCAQLHDVLVADTNCEQIYHFELNGNRTAFAFTTPQLQDLVADNTVTRCSEEMGEILFGSGFGVVTDIETGPDGLLYVLTLGDRTLYRIVPTLPAAIDPDGDGVDSACDCAPTDASTYGLPLVIPRLRLSGKSPTRIGWNAQSAETGTATTFTVVTGTVSTLRDEMSFASACTLASGLGTPRLEDARMPAAGKAFYYLARASNVCGNASFGDGSPVPDPRDQLDATLPSPCS